jgi:methionyl-tRNA formyltransferase
MANKVVFFGTPKIAARCLQALLDLNIEIAAVVTKVDKPIGRRQIIVESEVKKIATQNNIKILQPTKMNDVYDELVKINPDLIVVCAYGKIIPEKILNIPKYHCVNVHTSLLPR